MMYSDADVNRLKNAAATIGCDPEAVEWFRMMCVSYGIWPAWWLVWAISIAVGSTCRTLPPISIMEALCATIKLRVEEDGLQFVMNELRASPTAVVKLLRPRVWECPSCHAAWPSIDHRDGYGCDSPSCLH